LRAQAEQLAFQESQRPQTNSLRYIEAGMKDRPHLVKRETAVKVFIGPEG